MALFDSQCYNTLVFIKKDETTTWQLSDNINCVKERVSKDNKIDLRAAKESTTNERRQLP